MTDPRLPNIQIWHPQGLLSPGMDFLMGITEDGNLL